MLFIVIGAIVLWFVGAGVTVAALKPNDSTSGALVLFIALFMWPLVALGWLVSRPWA